MKKSNPDTHPKSKHPVEHLYRFLSICNTRCLFSLARVISIIVRQTNNQVSRQTTQNIDLCFPHYSLQQKDQLIKESIFHTCCAFTELASLWTHDVEEVLSKIKLRNIEPEFLTAHKSSIIIVPHHGSWELMNYWLASQGDLYALYKPARKKSLDNYIYKKRTRNGAKLVATNTAGIRKLMKGLKSGANCMILPDQRPGKNTSNEDSMFFSNPVKTSLLIKNLSAKIDCNLYIGAVTRNTSSGEYQIDLKKLDREKFLAADKDSADYLNAAIQIFVSNQLEQYQWSYRRFTEAAYEKKQS